MAKNSHFINSIKFPLVLLAVMWAIQLFQVGTGVDLGYLGIRPRAVYGLKGILFSPFVHSADIDVNNMDKLMPRWQHLVSNTPVFFVSTALLMYFYRKVALRSFVMISFLTGLAVWLFARGNSYHIGASGVIYGLVSFIFWSGIFRRNFRSIVLALIVMFLYSGMLAGVLPTQPGVSWESHLLGGLVGIFVAYWYKEEIEKDEEPKVPSWELEPQQDPQYFLRRDAFDTRKDEREGLW